jgi:hypothetical protein
MELESPRKPDFETLARKFRTTLPKNTAICMYCGFDFGEHQILTANCPYEELRQDEMKERRQ